MGIAQLHAAWQAALEHWTDAARHDTLLGLAAKHEQLAWLASKYRDAAWSNPADPIAPARLARLQRAATIIALARIAPEAPHKRPFRGALAMLVGAMLATALGLYIADYKMQRQQTIISRHP